MGMEVAAPGVATWHIFKRRGIIVTGFFVGGLPLTKRSGGGGDRDDDAGRRWLTNAAWFRICAVLAVTTSIVDGSGRSSNEHNIDNGIDKKSRPFE
mmetsp:Transcript_3758/g.4851  ORF Transcript_3758/g.4851 Transcript_3758/m.4851 type:complete len:96 (-) Transcript_3758:324-611(-)